MAAIYPEFEPAIPQSTGAPAFAEDAGGGIGVQALTNQMGYEINSLGKNHYADLIGSGLQTIPHATVATLTWDVELRDPDGMHAPGGYAITTQNSGLWVVFAQIGWQVPDTTGMRILVISCNAYSGFVASTAIHSTGILAGVQWCITPPLVVNAGAYFWASVYQESGIDRGVDKVQNRGRFAAWRIGARR